MRKTVTVIGFILVIVALAACATFTRDAYRALTVSQQAYDATMSIMGDMYREGKITTDQKDKAIELGRVYKLAHNEAVTTLATYEESGSEASKEAYLKAAALASSSLAKLIAYCRPLVEKGGK